MNLFELVAEAKAIGMLQHDEEITALAAFLAALEPTNVMEIGSWKGGTFRILCGLSKPEGMKVSQDVCAYGDLPGGFEPRNAMMKSWTPNVHTLLGFSQDPRRQTELDAIMQGRLFDFILIDGDHSYYASKLDYEMYSPRVRKGGWIGFHDINDTDFHRGHEYACEVPKLWKELQGNKIELTIKRDWGGIGLIQKE